MKLISIVEECIKEQFLKKNPTQSPVLLKTNQIVNPDRYFKTDSPTPSQISDEGINFIKKFESFRPTVYVDPDNNKTIGYGTRVDYHSELINRRLNEVEASKIMENDLISKTIPSIKELVKIPLRQNQLDALSSLVYNIGPTKFAESNLLKMINQKDVEGIKKDWSEFRLSGGKVLNGLVRRRAEELKTFFS